MFAFIFFENFLIKLFLTHNKPSSHLNVFNFEAHYATLRWY